MIPDLQIFIQPMYSKQELNADSNYVVYTAWVRAVRRIRPHWAFVVIFPDDQSGFRYEDDGFFDLPNVIRLPQRISPRKLSNAVTFDGSWYDVLFRKIGFDAVWCNLVEVAAQVKHAGAGTYEAMARPFVVAAHNYVIHDVLPYPIDALRHLSLAQMMGAVEADWNVFNSDFCDWMFFDMARRFLSLEAIQEIQEKKTKINYGVLEPDLEPDWDRPDPEVPLIAYNHRLQSYKKYRETFEVLDELHREGIPFRLRYMSNTTDDISRVEKFPWVDVRLCPTREIYLKELRECHLNTSNSVHETFCISAVESMALGQPFIAPRGITFPEITGEKETKYPYLFILPVEQKDYLRTMLTDHEERRKWGRVLSDYVRANFTWELWAERYVDLFERMARDAEPTGAQEDAVDFIRESLEKNPGKTVMEMATIVRGKRLAGRIPWGNQSLPLTKLVRILRRFGEIRWVRGAQRVFPESS